MFSSFLTPGQWPEVLIVSCNPYLNCGIELKVFNSYFLIQRCSLHQAASLNMCPLGILNRVLRVVVMSWVSFWQLDNGSDPFITWWLVFGQSHWFAYIFHLDTNLGKLLQKTIMTKDASTNIFATASNKSVLVIQRKTFKWKRRKYVNKLELSEIPLFICPF